MIEITTTRAVNLGQLSQETGWQLAMLEVGTDRTVTCLTIGVERAALQAAVDAHVAIDEQGNRATLEDRANAALGSNRDFLALASPTNAQVVAQVKALTRQANGLIRLALGDFDGID